MNQYTKNSYDSLSLKEREDFLYQKCKWYSVAHRIERLLKDQEPVVCSDFTKNPAGFLRWNIQEDINSILRLHYFPIESTTNIHSHWYSALSCILSWKIQETSYTKLYQWDDEKSVLREFITSQYFRDLYSTKLQEKNIQTIQSLLDRLDISSWEVLDAYTEFQILNNNVYMTWEVELSESKVRILEPGEFYFMPLSKVHKVQVQEGTITLFVRDKSSVMEGNVYPASHYKWICYYDDKYEKWETQQLSEQDILEFLKEIYQRIKKKAI